MSNGLWYIIPQKITDKIKQACAEKSQTPFFKQGKVEDCVDNFIEKELNGMDPELYEIYKRKRPKPLKDTLLRALNCRDDYGIFVDESERNLFDLLCYIGFKKNWSSVLEENFHLSEIDIERENSEERAIRLQTLRKNKKSTRAKTLFLNSTPQLPKYYYEIANETDNHRYDTAQKLFIKYKTEISTLDDYSKAKVNIQFSFILIYIHEDYIGADKLLAKSLKTFELLKKQNESEQIVDDIYYTKHLLSKSKNKIGDYISAEGFSIEYLDYVKAKGIVKTISEALLECAAVQSHLDKKNAIKYLDTAIVLLIKALSVADESDIYELTYLIGLSKKRKALLLDESSKLDAKLCFLEAAQHFRDIKNDDELLDTLFTLAHNAHSLNEPIYPYFREVLSIFSNDKHWDRYLEFILINLGEKKIDWRILDPNNHILRILKKVVKNEPNDLRKGLIHLIISQIQHRLFEYEKAIESVKIASAIYNKKKYKLGIINSGSMLVALYLQTSNLKELINEARDLIPLLESMPLFKTGQQYTYEVTAMRCIIGLSYLQIDKNDQAFEYFIQAQDLVNRFQLEFPLDITNCLNHIKEKRNNSSACYEDYCKMVNGLFLLLKNEKRYSHEQIITEWYSFNQNTLLRYFYNIKGLKGKIYSDNISEIKYLTKHLNWLFDCFLVESFSQPVRNQVEFFFLPNDLPTVKDKSDYNLSPIVYHFFRNQSAKTILSEKIFYLQFSSIFYCDFITNDKVVTHVLGCMNYGFLPIYINFIPGLKNFKVRESCKVDIPIKMKNVSKAKEIKSSFYSLLKKEGDKTEKSFSELCELLKNVKTTGRKNISIEILLLEITHIYDIVYPIVIISLKNSASNILSKLFKRNIKD